MSFTNFTLEEYNKCCEFMNYVQVDSIDDPGFQTCDKNILEDLDNLIWYYTVHGRLEHELLSYKEIEKILSFHTFGINDKKAFILLDGILRAELYSKLFSRKVSCYINEYGHSVRTKEDEELSDKLGYCAKYQARIDAYEMLKNDSFANIMLKRYPDNVETINKYFKNQLKERYDIILKIENGGIECKTKYIKRI